MKLVLEKLVSAYKVQVNSEEDKSLQLGALLCFFFIWPIIYFINQKNAPQTAAQISAQQWVLPEVENSNTPKNR